MKRKVTKKNFTKFKNKSSSNRRTRQKEINKILGEIEKSGVNYSSFKFRDTVNSGAGRRTDAVDKRGRVSCGTFLSTKSGFGFVRTEDGFSKDVFIPEGKTLFAVDGDYVEVSYRVFKSFDGEEKTEGRITKIIKKGRDTIIGTLAISPSYMKRGHRVPASYTVIPDEPNLNIYSILKSTNGAREGDKIVCRLVREKISEPYAEVTAILGDTFSKEANYKAILIDSQIPIDFTQEELEEAERLSKIPICENGRRVIKSESVFTMDSESAKDLDDAVSVRRLKNGWQLGVHIADVSSYVLEKTPLDRAVMKRGTSVYFTDKVVPMLPKALSNGACSLNPGEDKYALSAFIGLDNSGQITSLKLEKTIIRSKVKGVYSEINKIFDSTADASTKEKYKSITPSLFKMRELYEILLAKSKARGAVEMEISEAKIVLNESGEPVSVEKIQRGLSERIIEQFMLCANEAVAVELSKKNIPCVYRVHDMPSPDKVKDFTIYLRSLGIDCSTLNLEKTEAKALNEILEKAEQKGLLEPVSYAMLRSMAKAKYSEHKSLHFGLGIESYCHFTSPIRRLSDLATHRIIHKVLFEGKKSEKYLSYAARAAAAATESELRAISAERKIENLYKVIYMSDKIGCEYEATICSVTSFGIFAKLENTCEGLIPISEMGGMFVFDDRHLSISRGLVSYKLGDRIVIRVEQADIISGKLRFSLVKRLSL